MATSFVLVSAIGTLLASAPTRMQQAACCCASSFHFSEATQSTAFKSMRPRAMSTAATVPSAQVYKCPEHRGSTAKLPKPTPIVENAGRNKTFFFVERT
jgi:hypothetical protein